MMICRGAAERQLGLGAAGRIRWQSPLVDHRLPPRILGLRAADSPVRSVTLPDYGCVTGRELGSRIIRFPPTMSAVLSTKEGVPAGSVPALGLAPKELPAGPLSDGRRAADM